MKKVTGTLLVIGTFGFSCLVNAKILDANYVQVAGSENCPSVLNMSESSEQTGDFSRHIEKFRGSTVKKVLTSALKLEHWFLVTTPDSNSSIPIETVVKIKLLSSEGTNFEYSEEVVTDTTGSARLQQCIGSKFQSKGKA